MLEEITRRGGLSAPPHHDRPPRRGIHVESSDRTLVDPARTRHEAFRRHDLLEARQPLARKRRIQLQRPMDRPPESCTAQWRGIDRQPELLLDHRPRSNGQVLTGQLQTPLLERFAGPRTTIVADRSRQQQQFGMPVRLPHAERPPVIRITRIGERAGQRKERCCRATVRRIRSRTQRTASDSGVLRKGRTRRPGLRNARHCRAYCARPTDCRSRGSPAEKAAPDMGAAATGYRASPNRAPDLPSTRNDGCNAADRPRRGKRRAAATGRRGRPVRPKGSSTRPSVRMSRHVHAATRPEPRRAMP